jgi:phenylacetate-CoA ligase
MFNIKNLIKIKTDNFEKEGQKNVLKLFKFVAKEIPAYKHFLKKHKCNPEKIRTIDDFKNFVPLTDKETYLKKYPLEDLVPGADITQGQWTYSATSGTTGEPFYFPRNEIQDAMYAATAELYLKSNFQIHKKSTLYINAFAMGAWIGGVFTHSAITHLAKTGNYNLSIISPGLNKPEVLKAIKKLGPLYDQVILGGYPPFVKDVVEEGVNSGIDWKSLNLKGIIFSAEGFSEKFRDYVLIKAGLKNPLRASLNHYGTVDLGTMSHETPLSILVRRLTLDHKNLNDLIFEDINRLPTLTQYDPRVFYFEEVNRGLICSANSGIPLIRYDLKDKGGIFGFQSLKEKFTEAGLNLNEQIQNYKIQETIRTLPFVFVYERSDLVVSWSGANIYPEHIRECLQKDWLQKYVTGKFTMQIKHKKNHSPYLLINSELKPKVKQGAVLAKRLQSEVIKTLLEKNSEFKNNYLSSPKQNVPIVKLWPYSSAPYFTPGGKQKWTLKK